MNAILPPELAGLSAWPVAPGALLVAGRSTRALPEAGIARLQRRRTDRGPFRALSWPLIGQDGIGPDGVGQDGDGGDHGFVAAIRLPPDLAVAPALALRLEARSDLNDPAGRAEASHNFSLPDELGGPRSFAEAVLQLISPQPGRGAPACGVQVAAFLLGMFPAAAMQRVPAIGAMLALLLAGLSEEDGCVELMGAIPPSCGFLQGWGAPLLSKPGGGGAVEALLVGQMIVRCRVLPASFARPDIVAPSSGAVLVLAAPAGAVLDALPGLEQVYLLSADSVRRRALVASRLLGHTESSGHIRYMLPSLNCPPEAAECLRQALRPRYEGRETLHEQAATLRAAIDQAVTLPAEPAASGAMPAGVYLSGWLFDPGHAVTEVTLRDASGHDASGQNGSGLATRLDTRWTRIERPDVSAALARDGLPAPDGSAQAAHCHGFAAYVEAPGLSAGAPLYLDIGLRDGGYAFLPVQAALATEPAARAAVLLSADLHKRSGLAVVEDQLGPLFLAMLRRRPPPPRPRAPVPPGGPAGLAVVVALVGSATPPRAVLSQFLLDPLGAGEVLVLVCGSAWDAAGLAKLQSTAAFMGLPARVLHAPAAGDITAALEVAAAELAAAHYLLLDAAVAGGRRGWRQALRAAAAASASPAVACPTVLYEDLSIRYAGSAGLAALPASPYASVTRPLAGMPAAMVPDLPPRPATLGTLACCLLPHRALAAFGGSRPTLATPFGQETAVFLRLRNAGMECLWVPRAVVYAPDRLTAPSPGHAVGRLVDGWCLRAALQTGLFDAAAAPPPALVASGG